MRTWKLDSVSVVANLAGNNVFGEDYLIFSASTNTSRTREEDGSDERRVSNKMGTCKCEGEAQNENKIKVKVREGEATR